MKTQLPFLRSVSGLDPRRPGRLIRNPRFYRDFGTELDQAFMNLRSAEISTIKLIQKADYLKAHRHFGYRSLTAYLTSFGYSKSESNSLVAVSRKCDEFSNLGNALESGRLSIQKAKKILAILNSSNQNYWIEQSINLSLAELERALFVAFGKVAKTRTRKIAAEPKRRSIKIPINPFSNGREI